MSKDETKVKESCELGCDSNVLVLHGRCHISAPSWVFLDQEKNLLRVECSVCSKVVAQFHLKEKA